MNNPSEIGSDIEIRNKWASSTFPIWAVVGTEKGMDLMATSSQFYEALKV